MKQSSSCDGTCSWVMIVNAINKYVTEMTSGRPKTTTSITWEKVQGKLVAEARPKQASTPTTSTTTLPHDQRDWIDVTGLLRHITQYLEKKTEQSNSEILAQMFHSEFTSSQHWSIRAWLNYLRKGGGPKTRFQHCADPFHADTILHLRATQGHSGGKHNNPTLQDNVLLPGNFAVHIYHVGSFPDTHSIIQSGLIPGGKDVKKGRHTVFFTAVNPMFIDHHRESFAT